jgi:hypothetical protein
MVDPYPQYPTLIVTTQPDIVIGGGGSSVANRGPIGPEGPPGPTGPLPSDYVVALDGVTGNIGITSGSGVLISKSGSTFTITNSGVRSVSVQAGLSLGGTPNTPIFQNDGVLKINNLKGLIGLTTSGNNVSITTSGNTLTISVSSGSLGPTGPTGATGSININEPLFTINTGITKSSSFTSGTSGLARKIVMLAQDGSLTFDYIRNYDIFNPSDFAFSISSFTTTLSQTSLIGLTAFSFNGGSVSLSYGSIYPATGLTLSISGNGFGFPVNPGSPYTSYNFLSTQGITYSTVPQTTTLTATATNGTSQATSTLTFNFYNNVYYGVSTNSGITGDQINSTLQSVISNTRTRTIEVTSSTNEYVYYCYPSRLGASSFTVGIFSGGFEPVYTSGVTSGNGYHETFNVYRSTNSNLGTVSVTVS